MKRATKFLAALLVSAMTLSTVVSAAEELPVAEEMAISEEAVLEEETEAEEVVDEEEAVSEETILDEVIEEDEIDEEILEDEAPVDEEISDDDGDFIEEDAAAEGFSYSDIVAGYTVELSAKEGVFPQGTSVKVEKASEAREKLIKKMVEKSLGDAVSVDRTVTFDFEFTDIHGTVIEPNDGNVNVAICKEGAESVNAVDENALVFHVTDDNTVEQVAASGNSANVSFAASEFSSYTIVITNPNRPDTKAPVIKSAKLSKSKVDVNKRSQATVELVVQATDDYAGLGPVGTYPGSVTLYNKEKGENILFYLSKDKD